MHESTAFDEAMEEGELRGEVKRSHRLILRIGRSRLGSPEPADEVALAAIKDLERLERLEDALFTANSWRELLATP